MRKSTSRHYSNDLSIQKYLQLIPSPLGDRGNLWPVALVLLKASPSLEGFNAAINAQRGSPTWRQASCGRFRPGDGFFQDVGNAKPFYGDLSRFSSDFYGD